MSFKTSPRYVGEFAKSQYEYSKTLQKRYKDRPEYVSARLDAQAKIERAIRNYKRGLFTANDTIEILLKLV